MHNLISLGETIPDTSKEATEDKEDEKDSDEGRSGEREKNDPIVGSQYQLRGILVHSGQASGGHYYSFMHIRCAPMFHMHRVYRNVNKKLEREQSALCTVVDKHSGNLMFEMLWDYPLRNSHCLRLKINTHVPIILALLYWV